MSQTAESKWCCDECRRKWEAELLETIATLTAEREREKRSEWREGIVAVIDHEGDYLGCMGSKTWADVAGWMAGHGPIVDRLKRANERIEEVERERDALRTALGAYRAALRTWVCKSHREGLEGEHLYGNIDCDLAREALGGKS